VAQAECGVRSAECGMKRLAAWWRGVVRLKYRLQTFKDYGERLNRSATVEQELFFYAGSGQSCPPEVCKRLAIKLGTPDKKT
jgi:hypothetical protein